MHIPIHRDRRDLHALLPAEDSRDTLERLLRTLYVTRDAAGAWDEFFNNAAIHQGYDIGLSSPCSHNHLEDESNQLRKSIGETPASTESCSRSRLTNGDVDEEINQIEHGRAGGVKLTLKDHPFKRKLSQAGKPLGILVNSCLE